MKQVRVAVETDADRIETSIETSVLATADAVIDAARSQAGVAPAAFRRGEIVGHGAVRPVADGGAATREVFVPTEASSGECYHAPGGCGGHLVERVEATAAELVCERGLRPCGSAGCEAAGLDAPVRCDGCGRPVFDAVERNAARYCPECAEFLRTHPTATDHELYGLRDPAGETA